MMNSKRRTVRRTGRENVLPEGFDIWCRIEDLGMACGYNPATQFALLKELSDAYPCRTGQAWNEIAEDHPLQALAGLVRKYLAEFPKAAAKLIAGSGKPDSRTAIRQAVPAGPQAEKVA